MLGGAIAPKREITVTGNELQGLIPILGGVYGYLMAIGKIPRNPKEPEKIELWRRKFGPTMRILCPLVVISGILHLTGILA